MRVAARLTLANLVALLLAAAVPATGAGRERVALVLLPGPSPHTFEPTPASVRALTGAEMLFAIGHGLDDWAARPGAAPGCCRWCRSTPGSRYGARTTRPEAAWIPTTGSRHRTRK